MSVGFAAFAVCGCLPDPDIAAAHVPEIADSERSDARGSSTNPFPDAQPIGSPAVSRAVYGYLAPGRDFDAYRFEVAAPVTTTVSLLVPIREAYKDFDPRLSLGEGSTATREIPPGTGEAEYEPFSAVSFREVRAETIALVPGRNYYLIVHPGAEGSEGPYVIAFSGPERFSGREVRSTLMALPVIWSGGWAGAPPRPAAYACCGGVLLVGAVLVYSAVRRRRRRDAAGASNA